MRVRLLKLLALSTAAMLLLGVAGVHAEVNVPVRGLQIVPLPGLTASATKSEESRCAVRYSKTTEERRLLALQGNLTGTAEGVKALDLDYTLQLLSGEAPKLAVVVYDSDGGSWYKVAPHPMTADKKTHGRLSVAALRQTAFSDDDSGELEWANIERIWVGAVIDGASNGILTIENPLLTDIPYKPSKPLVITSAENPGTWGVSKEDAVTMTIGTPEEGPDGGACMRFDFNAPGGGHRWMIPSTPMPAAELEGYMALRLKYKATLPAGIPGLLLMISERGGAQWLADPPPPPTEDWSEITVPLDTFKLGSWTKDASGVLELENAAAVHVGAHGGPTGTGGKGLIMAADIQLVP